MSAVFFGISMCVLGIWVRLLSDHFEVLASEIVRLQNELRDLRKEVDILHVHYSNVTYDPYLASPERLKQLAMEAS